MIFKIVFEYFNSYDERCETTLHGKTEDEALAKAYNHSLLFGDGDFSVVSLKRFF